MAEKQYVIKYISHKWNPSTNIVEVHLGSFDGKNLAINIGAEGMAVCSDQQRI